MAEKPAGKKAWCVLKNMEKKPGVSFFLYISRLTITIEGCPLGTLPLNLIAANQSLL